VSVWEGEHPPRRGEGGWKMEGVGKEITFEIHKIAN